MHAHQEFSSTNRSTGLVQVMPRLKSLTPTGKVLRLALAALFLAAGVATTPAFAVTVPSKPDMAANTDSGSSSTDNITNVKQPTFTGTGTPFSAINLYAGGYQIGFGVVNQAGQWIIGATTKLSDGSWAITAKQTTVGVQSSASSALNIVVDTTSPTVSKPDLTPGSDHGTSNSDNMTNTQDPDFQGTGSPNSSVYLYNTVVSSSAPIGSAKVSAQGSWIATGHLPVSTTSYLIAARTYDVAGNASPLSAVLAMSSDIVAPATPPLPDLAAASDSGVSNADNITNINMPTFSAKGEAFAKITLYRLAAAPVVVGSAVADSSGVVTIKPSQPIPDGYYDIYSQVTDRSGNPAAHISPEFQLEIDTTPPDAPWKPLLDPASNSANTFDNITNITSPIVGGSFYDDNPNDTPPILTIDYFAGVFHYTKKALVSGYDWSITSPTIPSGVYDVTATNTDDAGNSAVSPALKLTIDDYPPTVVVSSPAAGASIGKLGSISGTIADFTSGPSQVIYILTRNSDGLFWNGTTWSPAFAPQKTTLSGGTWVNQAALPTGAILPLGSYTLAVAGSDIAGNSKSVTSTFTVVVPETVKPVALINTPVLNQKVLISDFISGFVGGSATDNIAVESVQVRLGRKRNNVNYYWNGTSFVTAASVVDATVTGTTNATWTWKSLVPPAAALDSGLYHVDVYAVDTSGNKSALVGRPFTLGTDFTAPDVLINTPTNNEALLLSNFKAGALTGTATDNLGIASVKVKLYRKRGTIITYWDGTDFVTTPTMVDATVTTVGNQSVSWNLTSPFPAAADLDQGVYSVVAYAFDAANNTKASAIRNFTLTSPIAPIMGYSGGNS